MSGKQPDEKAYLLNILGPTMLGPADKMMNVVTAPAFRERREK